MNPDQAAEVITLGMLDGIELHPGGGYESTRGIRYEPVGNGFYAGMSSHGKYFSKAYEEELPDEKGKLKKTGHWKLKLDNEEYTFKGDAIITPVFHTPSHKIIQSWIAGGYSTPTGAALLKRLNNYLRVFLDLPFESDYTVLAVLALQTWLREFVSSMVFGELRGQFGGGKTVSLECLEYAVHHGVLASSISGAGMARIIDAQKLTPLHDELDEETKGNDGASSKLAIMRQSQRKGQRYIRYRSEGATWDVCDVYSAQFFTSHGHDTERALGQRCLQITVRKSKDARLPIINAFRSPYAQAVLEDLFLWSLEAPFKEDFRQRVPEFLEKELSAKVVDLEKLSFDEQRQHIYDLGMRAFSDDWKAWLSKQRGRIAELGYCAGVVGICFGVPNELLASLKEAFDRKADRAEANEDILQAMVRESLIEAFNTEKARDDHLSTHDDLIFIPYTTVASKIKEKISALGWEKTPTPNSINPLLLELGFVEDINKKRMKIPPERLDEQAREKYPQGKSVECLVFDGAAREVLGLDTPSAGNSGNSSNQGNPSNQQTLELVTQVTQVTPVTQVTGVSPNSDGKELFFKLFDENRETTHDKVQQFLLDYPEQAGMVRELEKKGDLMRVRSNVYLLARGGFV